MTRFVYTRALVHKGLELLPHIAMAIAIVMVVQLAKLVVARLISGIFARATDPRVLKERRARTLEPLARSISSYILSFIGLIMVLGVFSINTTSIVATAGLASLAVGFGAQNLVRDVITGFFILFEDQFAVGDYVTVAGLSGIVDEMGLRVTKIRDFGGQLYVIPNGQIGQVTNHMGSKMRAAITVTVPKGQPVEAVLSVLADVAAQANAQMPEWVEGPSMLGVSRLGETSYDVELVGRTAPMAQFGAERELRLRAKRAIEDAMLG